MLINVMRKVYEPQLVLANKLLPVGVYLSVYLPVYLSCEQETLRHWFSSNLEIRIPALSATVGQYARVEAPD